MTIRDLECFYADKKEHYPISDEFVTCGNGKYRQSARGDNSYISEAQKQGLCGTEELLEPNQKWHLLIAYCSEKPDDMIIKRGTFKCPELILWMAEAAGIEDDVLKKASEKAKWVIDNENWYARKKAAKEMVAIIGWENLKDKIMPKNQDTN